MVRIPRLDYDYVIERILSFIRDSVKRELRQLVEQNKSAEEIIEEIGISPGKVREVIERVHRNEHKRLPPPIAKVSRHTVGQEWRMPWNLD